DALPIFSTPSLARSPSHDFYERRNQVLSADDFEGLRGLGQDTRIHRCSLRDRCMCHHRPMASLEHTVDAERFHHLDPQNNIHPPVNPSWINGC
ncbi:MAG: hypothetical protein VCE12_12465, partial [Candidatus Latescibacterota bacterium]